MNSDYEEGQRNWPRQATQDYELNRYEQQRKDAERVKKIANAFRVCEILIAGIEAGEGFVGKWPELDKAYDLAEEVVKK